jgi:hypothetical protein
LFFLHLLSLSLQFFMVGLFGYGWVPFHKLFVSMNFGLVGIILCRGINVLLMHHESRQFWMRVTFPFFVGACM